MKRISATQIAPSYSYWFSRGAAGATIFFLKGVFLFRVAMGIKEKYEAYYYSKTMLRPG